MKKSSILTILIGIIACSSCYAIMKRMAAQNERLDRLVSGAWTMDSGPVYVMADPFYELTDLWMPFKHRNGGTK